MRSLRDAISLKNKVAIVTGGAMGIGLGIARRLGEAGARIVIADINKESGQKAHEELVANGIETTFIKTDVFSPDDVTHACAFAVSTYGSIDILVNNAGIYPTIPVLKMQTADFEKIIAVNLKSAFLFTKAVAEIMIKNKKGGKIINITSIDALHPSAVGLAVYDASKHGLWGFTKNTALELAPHNIAVNAIAPGAIKTPGIGAGPNTNPDIQKILEQFSQKIPMKRIGEADEIGTVALFLASDLSSYMTGSQIVVDGGVLLS